MAILIPIIIVASIDMIAGLILAIASIVMHVPTDEKADAILEILPNANCGACGYSGCAGYAAALAKGEAEPNLCSPGGADVMKQIAELTGGAAGEMERKTALVMCMGSLDNTTRRMDYDGIQTCLAASQTTGGSSTCSFGCLGYGDCVTVCDHDAIEVCNGVAEFVQACAWYAPCVQRLAREHSFRWFLLRIKLWFAAATTTEVLWQTRFVRSAASAV